MEFSDCRQGSHELEAGECGKRDLKKKKRAGIAEAHVRLPFLTSIHCRICPYTSNELNLLRQHLPS